MRSTDALKGALGIGTGASVGVSNTGGALSTTSTPSVPSATTFSYPTRDALTPSQAGGTGAGGGGAASKAVAAAAAGAMLKGMLGMGIGVNATAGGTRAGEERGEGATKASGTTQDIIKNGGLLTPAGLATPEVSGSGGAHINLQGQAQGQGQQLASSSSSSLLLSSSMQATTTKTTAAAANSTAAATATAGQAALAQDVSIYSTASTTNTTGAKGRSNNSGAKAATADLKAMIGVGARTGMGAGARIGSVGVGTMSPKQGERGLGGVRGGALAPAPAPAAGAGGNGKGTRTITPPPPVGMGGASGGARHTPTRQGR